MPSGYEMVVRLHAPPVTVALANPDALDFDSQSENGRGNTAPTSLLDSSQSENGRGNTAPTSLLDSRGGVSPPEGLAPPEPRSLWETEIGQRLQEDRTAISSVLDKVIETARQAKAEQKNHLGEWQRAAVELAVTIATRLIHDRVVANDFAIETIVREALALLDPQGPFTVRSHPDDVALLESRLNGEPLFADGTEVRVVADPSLGRAGCRIESQDTYATARLGEQLATLRHELLRSLGDAESGS